MTSALLWLLFQVTSAGTKWSSYSEWSIWPTSSPSTVSPAGRPMPRPKPNDVQIESAILRVPRVPRLMDAQAVPPATLACPSPTFHHWSSLRRVQLQTPHAPGQTLGTVDLSSPSWGLESVEAAMNQPLSSASNGRTLIDLVFLSRLSCRVGDRAHSRSQKRLQFGGYDIPNPKTTQCLRHLYTYLICTYITLHQGQCSSLSTSPGVLSGTVGWSTWAFAASSHSYPCGRWPPGSSARYVIFGAWGPHDIPQFTAKANESSWNSICFGGTLENWISDRPCFLRAELFGYIIISCKTLALFRAWFQGHHHFGQRGKTHDLEGHTIETIEIAFIHSISINFFMFLGII